MLNYVKFLQKKAVPGFLFPETALFLIEAQLKKA